MIAPMWHVGRLVALVVAAVVGLAACGSDKPKPTPLTALTPKIGARLVWQSRVDGAQFPLGVAARNGRFHVAGNDGTVLAIDAETGREAWRASAGTRLSAGVGSDGRFAAVVTVDNEVVAFDEGKATWRSRLAGRVLTPPLVAGERVFVLTVDRIVHAFDAIDGRRLWTLQRSGDALTLGQAGVLGAYKDTLIVGQGPRLAGVDPLRGTLRWEVALAQPRGSNEVERLADLVGPALRVDNQVCARAFQSAVGCVDAERGTLGWSRNVGGTQAVGGGDAVIVGADASDRITAWRQASGEMLWTSERLMYRGLSGALGVGKAIVFGDFEGQVHFLDRDSGDPVLRLTTDGSQIVGTPVLSGTTMLVVTRNGGLYAYRPE
jgi:outer membrane protein assembly factor BamB